MSFYDLPVFCAINEGEITSESLIISSGPSAETLNDGNHEFDVNDSLKTSLNDCVDELSSMPERAAPNSHIRRKHYTKKTLLINKDFDDDWPNILASLDSHRLLQKPVSLPLPSIEAKKLAQDQLMSAIIVDDGNNVREAINLGASFLTNDFDAHIRTSQYCPIEYAVILNSIDALRTMFSFVKDTKKSLLNVVYGGLTIRAVQAGQFDVLRLLVPIKGKATYLEGSFLLHQAIMHKAPLNVFELLIQKFGKKPELFGTFGSHQDNPLHFAVRHNNPEAFYYLFELPNINKNQINVNGMRPINLVFSLSRVKFLTKLIANHSKIRLSWTDEYGNTLLHFAVYQENISLVKFMVESLHLLVNFPNEAGQTSLHIATAKQFREIMWYLIDYGASVVKHDRNNICPLLLLARSADFEAFKRAAVSINLTNSSVPELQACIQALIKEGLYDFVEVMLVKFPIMKNENIFFLCTNHINQMLQSGLIWNFPNLVEIAVKMLTINPNSIIHQSAVLGKTDIFKVLIAYGADLNMEHPITGEKPVDFAIKYKQSDIVRIALSHVGWVITTTCHLDDFVLVLTSGGSFCLSRSPNLLYFQNNLVLGMFINYFAQILQSGKLNIFDITTVCIQLEIFLFYHFKDALITHDLFSGLRALQTVKQQLASILTEPVKKYYPLLESLIGQFSVSNVNFVRRCLEVEHQHSIPASELSGYINPLNHYLLADYHTIL